MLVVADDLRGCASLELHVERATDLVVVLAGHDVSRGLVQEARWTVPTYKAWLFTTLVQELLDAHSVEPEAAAGLFYAEGLSPPAIR